MRAQDVERIGILGPGTIDGNRTKRHGPKPIALKNCRHIAVRDITLRNSPNYNISLLGCDYVNIEGVTILNGYADGIDPDCCHHVRIANCYVEAFDDAIVPKASFALGYRRSTENVTVTNCVLNHGLQLFQAGHRIERRLQEYHREQLRHVRPARPLEAQPNLGCGAGDGGRRQRGTHRGVQHCHGGY